MAVDSITTNADLITNRIMSDAEIDRLQTSRMASTLWSVEHNEAWTMIKRHLANWPTPVTEDDLDDTSELDRASCYYVAYLAYKNGPADEDKQEAKDFLARFRREMEEVELTVNGYSITRGAYAYRLRARRA